LRLRGAASCATILISVDQARSWRERADGSAALVDYLRVAAASSRSSAIAFTIRTDSFPELQRDDRSNLRARLTCVQLRSFGLKALLNPQSVTAWWSTTDLLTRGRRAEDDALPLLAFAPQRLWRQYAASALKEAFTRR
jgi:hypothetical protein